MNLPISKVIRRLRRERDITQEELAAAVGVTYQSVSRWENGLAYPDMELIPRIAQYFAISTDLLFGTDSASVKTRLDIHYRKINEVRSDLELFYQACKSAYEEFPKEFSFGLWLCRCYVYHGIRPYEEHLDEIRDICRNIIDHCTNENIRIEAMEMIVIAEKEENLDRWLGMMPSWKSCKEVLLESRYGYHRDHEKYRIQRQENFISFVEYAFYNCNEFEDSDVAVSNFKMILNVIDVLRDPTTDVDAWMVMRADFYARLALAYFSKKDFESGYAGMEKAIALYVKYAQLPANTLLSYNCPALNVLRENKLHSTGEDIDDNGGSVCRCAYHTFCRRDGVFESLQNEERYKKQLERLVPYLTKDAH